jgi:hypothetical protein
MIKGRIPEPVIPSLQAVIHDARAVALQLRPPRMQEAGVLATLHSFVWQAATTRHSCLRS